MNPLKVCPQCGTEYPLNARFCEIDGTALRSAGAEQDMVGSIIADRYHVLKKLGEGGMGQVYLAEHVKMGRKSALKVMHPGMVKDVDAISRFNREAANASKISHPNVAAVYDFGETSDGVIFLAMEFVDGPPLTKVIEQAGALPAKRAAEIVRQTGEALAVAHDMAIVHRDLKPDNIMIAKTRDGGDLVKVVDFGIAKAAGSDAQKVTKTGLVVGTPEYMSPEQLAGDKLDGRSDIYALGLVAFNMLTGKLPFPSDSAQESMIMRLTDRPKPLAEMRPEVSWPAEVQSVMDKALERDMVGRYQTATEFGRDLQRAIERMPQTLESELGTQMMVVPVTRAAPAPEAAITPRTSISPGIPGAHAAHAAAAAAVAAANSAAPVMHAAAAQKKKNMIPVIGGVAGLLVVAAAAVVAPKFLGNNEKGAKGPDTSQPTSAVAPAQTKAAAETTTTTPPLGTQRGAPASQTTPGNPVGTPTVNIAKTLQTIESDAASASKAHTVPGQVNRLLPQLTTAKDSARANFVLFRAYVTLEQSDSTCRAILEAIRLSATDQEAKSRYEARAAGASCG